ncbi:MAG: hypothetical protein AAF501_06450, partial [Pseudomonadota bacterium]
GLGLAGTDSAEADGTKKDNAKTSATQTNANQTDTVQITTASTDTTEPAYTDLVSADPASEHLASADLAQADPAQADPAQADLARIGLTRAGLFRGAAPLGLCLALGLVLLPLGVLQRLTGLALAGRTRALRQVFVFCDSHLSGYLLCRALEARGVATASLQHALYRADDPGSAMNVHNRAARRILLWDRATEAELAAAGHPPARLHRIGAYGFGHLTADAPADAGLVAFCPPYDARWLALFRTLADQLPAPGRHFFSLHPLLAARHPDIPARPVALAEPRPAVAICGDSGVIMDCLARGIPVLSIAARPLATTHLNPEEAGALQPQALRPLLDAARAALAADRAAFGFTCGRSVSGESVSDGFASDGFASEESAGGRAMPHDAPVPDQARERSA